MFTARYRLKYISEVAGVQFQINPCEICGGQGGTRTVFSEYFLFFPVSIIPMLRTYLGLHVALPRTNGRSLRTFAKAVLLRKLGSIGYKTVSLGL